MEDVTQDVSVDSSTTSDSVDTSAQATTAPAPSTAPDRPAPFHEHPRFRELTSQNRSLKEQVAQMSQRVNQLERLSSRADSQGGLTQEEQAQYRDAATALKRIFAADPELAQLFEARKHLPQLAQGYQSLQQLSRAQAQAAQSQARTHIERLAAKEGLPTDKKYLTHLTRLVAGEAMNLQDGNERYDRGDLSVLDEAFESVKGTFISLMRKEAAATTTQTKNKLKTMPPAPRGGAAGPEAPKAPEPGQERAFVSDMHKRGLALLRERLTEK
jgi:hypothetical protein